MDRALSITGPMTGRKSASVSENDCVLVIVCVELRRCALFEVGVYFRYFVPFNAHV